MGRQAPSGLSKHPTKGYRIGIGKKPGGGYRTFWLGQHRGLAEYAAYMYRERFGFMQARGRDVWMQDDEDAVRAFVDQYKFATARHWENHQRDVERVRQQGEIFAAVLGDTPTTLKPSSQPEAPKTGKTLYDAIDGFLEALKAKRKSESHRWRMEQIIKINLKRIRDNCDMTAIDFAWLDSLADYYKARPLSNRGKKKNRKPISPHTVKTTLSHLRQFFVWCDDVAFGGWEAPRKLTKPFRVRLDDLRTRSELREVGQIEQFEIATLVKLYKTGSEFQQAIMLSAIFTGGTQQELAVLEKDEFDLDKAVLHHHRNKTNVEGRFWLPPELVTLLRSQFADHRKRPLAFYTSAGSPLVTYREGRMVSDAVRQSWDDLREAAELPDALSFKFLRKYLADWMTRHGGEEMGQIALSHARQTVLAKHYSTARDFERFFGLAKQMHAEFVAAGMFGAES